MRLTLRTLLAYLDDILEPKQTKELGEKIAESHFATSLINRIREVLRRRRLTAPTLSGPGSGLDPNTVAEYLDNTLAPEKVADVEKTCLESDIHLAEVAGCHQILTLVLGEPVEIVPESRERIYALTAPESVVTLPPPGATAQKQQRTAAKSEAPPTAPPVAARSATVEADDFRKGIPDYLRKPPLWKRMLPVGAVVAGVLLVAMMVWNPDAANDAQVVENRKAPPTVDVGANPEKSLKLPKQQEPDVDAQPANVAANDIVFEEDVQPEETAEPNADVVIAQSDVVETLDAEFDIDPPAPPDGEFEVATALPGEVEAADAAPEDINLFPPTETPEGTLPLLENPIESEADTQPAQTSPESPSETADGVAPPAETVIPIANEEDKVAVVGTTPERLDNVVSPAPKYRPPASAQYRWFEGNQQGLSGIVLINDPNDEGWRKLAPRSMIHPGDRIAVPDPYIASLLLSEGKTHLTLLPGSQNGSLIELTDATEAGHCTIKVSRGRLVFRGDSKGAPAAERPVQIGLKVGDELWQVKFLTPDAVWGLEVSPQRPEGFEQQLGENTYTADLYVAKGTIQFSDGDQPTIIKEGPGWIPLTPGQRPRVNPDGTVEASPPLTAIPNWLGPPQLTHKQREHCRLFAREFDEVQPIDISLVGAVDHHDADIATLGVKCFALTENPQVLVKALSNSDFEDARRAAADGLRDWLPLDPANAETLKNALSKAYHEENANAIYRLLWGFPKSDARLLEPSRQLVTWMGHEQAVIRELAFDQVQRLTDKQSTLQYHPTEGTDVKRNRAVERWREFVNRNNGLLLDR